MTSAEPTIELWVESAEASHILPDPGTANVYAERGGRTAEQVQAGPKGLATGSPRLSVQASEVGRAGISPGRARQSQQSSEGQCQLP